MARQTGLIKFTGSIGPITGYQVDGKHFIKEKGRVSKHRYQNSPQFKKLRENASVFGKAVKLAKVIYDRLPPGQRDQKKVWYPLRNRAQELLKEGKDSIEVSRTLNEEWASGKWRVTSGEERAASSDLRAVSAERQVASSEEIMLGRYYGRVDWQLTKELAALNSLVKNLLVGEAESWRNKAMNESGRKVIRETRRRW